MRLLNNFFKSNKIECPRCLGKGNVDIEDIKRLKKELFWIPGKCAYCNGKGKVPPERIEKISVDFDYLTTDLSFFERHRVISGNKNAISKGNLQTELIKQVIEDIQQLYYNQNKNANEIAELISRKYNIKLKSDIDKQDIIDFIEHVIKNKTQN